MAKKIEFLFDFVSPASWVAYKRMGGIVERTGAHVEMIPVFRGGIMQGSGNSPPFSVPNKGKYTGIDLARFAKKYGVAMEMNPFFPLNTLPLVRTATALKGTDRFCAYVDAVFEAVWLHQKNMADRGIAAEVLAAAGFDPAEMQALGESAEIKQTVKKTTDDAIARGVFGAPTFFVDGEMWFGQDRLDWVEEAAAA